MATAQYYKAKYQNMTEQDADRLADLDRRAREIVGVKEPALCRIDEPDCESCQ